jgi:hypothetical protein
MDQQPEGRKVLPPVNNSCPDAKCEEGVAKKCADQQVGENRYYLNSHVASKQGE